MANLPYIPPEVLGQYQEARRRQALAELMAQQAIAGYGQTQYTPGPYARAVPAGLAEGLARLGANWMNQTNASDAASEQDRILQAAQAAQAAEMNALYSNPREQLPRALASQIPVVRAAAADMLKREDELEKERQKRAFDLLKEQLGAYGKVDAVGATRSWLSGKLPNNVPDWQAPRVEAVPDPMKPGGQVGLLIEQGEGGRPKATFQPAGTNIVNNLGSKANQALFEGELKGTEPGSKPQEAAFGARRSLDSIQAAIGAIDRGAATGTVEPYLQTARGVLKDLFGIETSANAPTGELSALLKAKVLDEKGSLGAGFSNEDRIYFAEAGGDIATNPEALKRLLAIQARMAIKVVNTHNARIQALLNNKTAELDPVILQGRLIPLGDWRLPDTPTGRDVDLYMQQGYGIAPAGAGRSVPAPVLRGKALVDSILGGGR